MTYIEESAFTRGYQIMLWFALISLLIGCIIIIVIIIIVQIRLESRKNNDIQSELDKIALLQSHGYEIGEKIGHGAYADVRKAYSIANKREVAVKIVNKREVKIIIVSKR